jgi:FixJ family two-component response regulator
MPMMTGWKLHDELRARGENIPVVYMSAGYRVGAEAAARGAAGCLAKPFDIEDFLRAVEQFAA